MHFFTHGRALIIGVGDYQDPQWTVQITVADAECVADALTDPAVGAYPPEQVQVLTGAQTTRAGVTAALTQLAHEARVTDTVVIFFCGHGALGTDGVYHFATHEAVFVDGNVQAGTGLSAPDLIALLRDINAQKLLFIINACFSGRIAPTLGAPAVLGAPPSASFNAEALASGEGRAIITASRPTQYSHYGSDVSSPTLGGR